MKNQPYRIDPPGCACTDCITGSSVPLDSATTGQVFAMLSDKLADATGHDFTMSLTVTSDFDPGLSRNLSWSTKASLSDLDDSGLLSTIHDSLGPARLWS